jgi:hypothetical protein
MPDLFVTLMKHMSVWLQLLGFSAPTAGLSAPKRGTDHSSEGASKATNTAAPDKAPSANQAEQLSSTSTDGKGPAVVVSHPVSSGSSTAVPCNMVLAACSLQVLLPPDSPEGESSLHFMTRPSLSTYPGVAPVWLPGCPTSGGMHVCKWIIGLAAKLLAALQLHNDENRIILAV